MRKSNHSVDDVRIIDKMTEVSFGNGNQEDYNRLMDIAQQPNTSNETQNSDVNMVEVRVQTPVSRTKPYKGSPPEGIDAPPKAKRKRRARNVEVKDAQNVHSSPRRPLTLNGDSSSNEIPPYSPSRVITPNNHATSSSGFSPTQENGFRDVQIQTEHVVSIPNPQSDIEKVKSAEEFRSLSKSLEATLKENDKLKNKNVKGQNIIRELLIEQMNNERKKIREIIQDNNRRIGYFKLSGEILRHGENWIDGCWKEEIERRKAKLDAEKEDIASEANSLKKKKTVKELKKVSENDDDGFLKPELPQLTDLDRKDEILRARKEYIKREDAEIAAERERLDRERNLHIREIKRVQHEDDSMFNKYTIQKNDRYVLLTLLGKGGFSEVWRAYDLDSYRSVACKIHRVNKQWNENKKASYVKHAIREKDIHKTLDHPNIVKMYELLTIDQDTFCTVLEYCDGNDLDLYLKQHGCLSERETRLVIGQVVDALRYLGDRSPPVIHYDLKPANILLQSGCRKFEVKITDFGLSKQVETSEDCDSIELTSQGAGTYWYLPPETFRDSSVKINTKVDVWSVGVICYQCIYGKRPFGHDQTQQRILNEGTILKANSVNFPAKPTVTQVAQDFIRKCLQYEPGNRADVYELSRHDFIKPFSRRIVQQPASPSSRAARDDLDH
uniref:Protein kinase domain-containing protein n=1 Tax=Panagrolaimus sp. ES5 TaxID=591445 RepID=A0AC34FM93_9BILA